MTKQTHAQCNAYACKNIRPGKTLKRCMKVRLSEVVNTNFTWSLPHPLSLSGNNFVSGLLAPVRHCDGMA